MGSAAATLTALRQRIAAIETAGTAMRPAAARLVPIDRGVVDAQLGGGLARGALHEFFAASAADPVAPTGFAALLALARLPSTSPVLWIRQEQAAREVGEIHADGLAALGLDPARLILVRLPRALAVLRAGVEAACSPAIGAALIEFWGEPKEFDLSAQRRLALAAETSGVTLFLLRPGARPMPGSAETRWQVRSSPAAALAMDAPGHPTFELTLLRHRHGTAGGPWRLEWNRDERHFRPSPLLRDLPALPLLRPAAPPGDGALLAAGERQAAPYPGEGKGAMRIAAPDPAALELGLVPGLALAEARARIADVAIADFNPAADEALIERLADGCDRYTPLVARHGTDTLLLDITGVAPLFKGERALLRDLLRRLSAAGLTAHGAIAGASEAARALARTRRSQIIAPGGEAEAVRELPVAALELGADATLALSRAGLKTLADLAQRPRAPLAARFGAEIIERLERLSGRAEHPISPRRPLAALLVQRVFFEPIARSEDIAATLADLCGQLARELETRGEGGRSFEASFYRVDGAVRRIAVATARPNRDPRIISRLFDEKLDALSDPLDAGFGFDLIRLGALRTEPMDETQARLDGGEPDEGIVFNLIDRLGARFGTGHVVRFILEETHIPERRSRLVPAIRLSAEPPGKGLADLAEAYPPGEPPRRPLTLLDPPEPVEALAEVPDGPPFQFRWRRALHRVTRAEGPERIAPEWWHVADRTEAQGQAGADAATTRDYYRVENEAGRRFWLYREGLYGSRATAPRWYMHGLFP